MARKKEHEKEPNHERWLVSYADFITLLFAVFVTLYAMSQTDKKKIEEVMASMRDSFGFTQSSAPTPSVIESGAMNLIPQAPSKATSTPMRRGKTRGSTKEFKLTKASLEAFLIKSGAQDKVSVSQNQRGLVVSLKEGGFFDSGSATIKPSAVTLLKDVIESLSEYSNDIRVEGHTDNIPISTSAFPSNWELSTARATNVLRYMMKEDFEPDHLSAAGYGEYRPIADNDSAEGRKKNRRVDIVLLSEQEERREPTAMRPVSAPLGSGPITPEPKKE
ncbi:flagellar motor protein MotB [Geomesophilobacter sediminis]|uniref:OmpA family protein n=1 Tax=Geomesophilobacter sediminis TaxID=2798584 RepID=A0A8J7LUM8_9BACT|nr:flagellar motor protein MotB [Geomesophilobacter sediminis]MBJ6724844.1 OmpA family protein [Geomesophilobacter sediminis]